LTPFDRINPCGYAGLRTVDLHTIGVDVGLSDVEQTLERYLSQFLGAV
ncbi:lipoyl(octanoyl) transferase, partial [Burkholderiaceae bacterium]|nr:lipoyl(octanoyl) transferase [Burkholderiaceae bacterium]